MAAAGEAELAPQGRAVLVRFGGDWQGCRDYCMAVFSGAAAMVIAQLCVSFLCCSKRVAGKHYVPTFSRFLSPASMLA